MINRFDLAWSNHYQSNDEGWVTNPDNLVTSDNIDCKQLKLKGMKYGKYFIQYFSPSDLSNHIDESVDWGPNVKIEYKLMVLIVLRMCVFIF